MQRSDKQSNVLFSRYSGKAISIARAVCLLRVAAARAPGKKARKRKIRSLSRKQNRVRSATLVFCYAPAWRCTPKRRLRARCEMESALKIHAQDVQSLVIEFYELHSSPSNGKNGCFDFTLWVTNFSMSFRLLFRRRYKNLL
jgi:hypothetical protein